MLTIATVIASAIAENTYAQAVIKIGVQNFAYFPHYDFTDQPQNSLAEQLFLTWAEAQNIEVEFVALPTKRLEHEFFVNGSVDWLFPANPRWFKKHSKLPFYSPPLVRTLSGTMILQENKNAEDNWFRSLSVPFGFAPVKYQALIENRDIVVFNSPTAESALQMVQKQHVSGADVEFNVAQHYLTQWPEAKPMTIDFKLPHVLIDFHTASSKESAAWLSFNQWLMDNKDEIARIKSQLNLIEYWPKN